MLLTACAYGAQTSPLATNVPVLREAGEGYQSLYRFAGGPRDGAHPVASLFSLRNRLFGTTMSGGKDGVGTVYRIGSLGVEQVLYSFPVADNGKVPASNLIAFKGRLYGTTYGGGGTDCTGGCGIVFGISASGSEKIIYAFTGSTDGQNPTGGLVAINGRFFGTTTAGGCAASSCLGSCNCGTIFAVSLSGNEALLHSFKGANLDGAFPHSGLTYTKGMLYGTTLYSVFKINPKGVFTVIHKFRGDSDGFNAEGDLLAIDGAIYGTTENGGGSGCGGTGCGTIFHVSAAGKEHVLYRFKGGSDGRNPTAGLIAIAGTLYGTTTLGGKCAGDAAGCGTIFSLSESTGAERVLYRFRGGEDGAAPGRGDLTNVKATLYGTTAKGGDRNNGTVFSFVP